MPQRHACLDDDWQVPRRTEDAEHRTIARPFGEVGFKAYMTRRVLHQRCARHVQKKA
jgi:hypothetical protein